MMAYIESNHIIVSLWTWLEYVRMSLDGNEMKSEIDDCANLKNKNDRNRNKDIFIGYITCTINLF